MANYSVIRYNVNEEIKTEFPCNSLQDASDKIKILIIHALNEFPRLSQYIIFAMYDGDTIMREHTLINYENLEE